MDTSKDHRGSLNYSSYSFAINKKIVSISIYNISIMSYQ